MRLTLSITGTCGEMGLNFMGEATMRRIEAREMDPYQEIEDWFLGDGGFGDYSVILHRPFAWAVHLDGAPRDVPEFETLSVERRLGWKEILFTMDREYDWVALLGYDDQPGRITYAWEGVAGFDPGRLAFLADRWDDVLCRPDYRVLRTVTYGGRTWDDVEVEEGQDLRSLWPPRFASLARVREMARAELYDPAQVPRA